MKNLKKIELIVSFFFTKTVVLSERANCSLKPKLDTSMDQDAEYPTTLYCNLECHIIPNSEFLRVSLTIPRNVASYNSNRNTVMLMCPNWRSLFYIGRISDVAVIPIRMDSTKKPYQLTPTCEHIPVNTRWKTSKLLDSIGTSTT